MIHAVFYEEITYTLDAAMQRIACFQVEYFNPDGSRAYTVVGFPNDFIWADVIARIWGRKQEITAEQYADEFEGEE